jgi:hypothetical protein
LWLDGDNDSGGGEGGGGGNVCTKGRQQRYCGSMKVMVIMVMLVIVAKVGRTAATMILTV